MVIAETVAAAKDAAELVAIDYEPLAGGDRRGRGGRAGRAAPVGRSRQRADRRARSATRRRPTRRSRAPPMWCGSRPGSSASPACRWSRARRSANTIAASRRYTRACRQRRRGAAQDRHRDHPRRGARERCASSCAMSAAISARAARSIRSSRWWPGRRAASAGRSSGPASATNPSSATTRAAISPSRPSSRSTRNGSFLAMRGSNTGNLGALTGNFSMVQKGVEIMSSIYRMPAAHFRARCVTTNTTPTRPYRSAGPARGDVRDGAADRPRGAPVRFRPRRAAPAQSGDADASCPTPIRSA